MRIILTNEEQTVMVNLYPLDPAKGEALCDEHLERLVGRSRIEVATREQRDHTWGRPRLLSRISVDQ